MENFTRLFKSCFSLLVFTLTMTSYSSHAGPREDRDHHLNNTAFTSGFKASTKCEDALLSQAVSHLPSLSTFSKLATQDKVLLLHKASNALSRVKEKEIGTKHDPSANTELERMIEHIGVLSKDPAATLIKYRDELLAMAYELWTIAPSSDRLSALATDNLIKFHEIVIEQSKDIELTQVTRTLLLTARLNLIALKSANIGNPAQALTAIDFEQLIAMKKSAQSESDWRLVLTAKLLLIKRALKVAADIPADKRSVFEFAANAVFHHTKDVYVRTMGSDGNRLPTSHLIIPLLEQIEKMPILKNFEKTQADVGFMLVNIRTSREDLR